jgi:hypothetical protein
MVAPFGMAIANIPMVPLMTMFVPAIVGVGFAGLLHIFVMPQLLGFAELGALLSLPSCLPSAISSTRRNRDWGGPSV